MSEIFEWSLIDHKSEKTTGSTKLKCPVCIGTRRDKSDRSLYVRYDSGVAKCFHCEALSFRDSVEKSTKENNFKLPEQTWKNYTKISDKLIKWLEEERKIPQFIVNELRWTEEMYYQPKAKKEVNNLVFNYFEGDVLVNKKYRSAKKEFTQSKDAKSIFYNINSAIGQKECYVVEGEIDVASLYVIGVKNVISVPNGANDNDAYWKASEPYLKDVEQFYIATDNDVKGDEVAEKIAQRLGRYRCKRVKFKNKDANEDLKDGVLEQSILNRMKYPVSGTFKVFDLYDEMIELYENGLPPVIYPKHKSFGDLKNVFSVMRGHLVTVTGIPSHGKSSYTEWYVLNLINDYDMKASFFSPEHQPLSLHQSSFVEKFCGKNYFYEYADSQRVDKIDIAKYAEWANEKLYLTSPDNGNRATWDWLFDKFKEQMFNFGIDIFVIDAYNKVEHTGNRSERERISSVLTRLTDFAQQNNVIIFLVAHPTKMQQTDNGVYKIPDLYSVSGSADFRNQTHDGYCIYRYFGDKEENDPGYTVFVNLKTKLKFQGTIGGKVEYSYHPASGRYYERGSEIPYGYITDYNKQIEEKPIPMLLPSDAFDGFDEINYQTEDNDIPF